MIRNVTQSCCQNRMYVRLKYLFYFYESALVAKGLENDRDRSWSWRERSRALFQERSLTKFGPDLRSGTTNNQLRRHTLAFISSPSFLPFPSLPPIFSFSSPFPISSLSFTPCPSLPCPHSLLFPCLPSLLHRPKSSYGIRMSTMSSAPWSKTELRSQTQFGAFTGRKMVAATWYW